MTSANKNRNRYNKNKALPSKLIPSKKESINKFGIPLTSDNKL